MRKLTVDQALHKANAHSKKGDIEAAQKLYHAVLQAFPKNEKAYQGLAKLKKFQQSVVRQGPPQEALDRLRALYELGRLEQAVELASAITNEYPNAFLVWNALGVASKRLGKTQQAFSAFKKVININPNYADGFNNFGTTLLENGRLGEAIEAFNTAISLKSDHSGAYFNMGNALKKQGKLEAATNAYQTAISIKPDYAEAYNSLGIALKAQGKLSQAVESYTKAILLQPENAEVCNNKAIVFQAQGKLDEAIVLYNHAISLKPDYADAYNNIGNVFKQQGRLDKAMAAYAKAISLNPDHVSAYNNRGNALQEQGNLDEAGRYYTKALSLEPDYADALYNMGNVFYDQGKLDEAIECYRKALLTEPDYADAYYNIGRIYWQRQDFVQAFNFMEWRWQKKQRSIGVQLKCGKPTWNGEARNKVFVWKEQGVGDEVMFSSMLSEVNKKSKKLIVECDKRLIPLYRRSFSKRIKFVDDRKLISEHEYDSHVAIGSLPIYFRKRLSDFSGVSSGWLKADRKKTNAFKRKLQAKNSERIIGISWLTNSSEARSKRRNISTNLFANCLKQIPAKYVNLQYGNIDKALSDLNLKFGLNLSQIDELDLFNDLDGFAALISACDIVISIDNATVHFAGALGVDTRVLLPFAPDDRWGVNQADSYWYTSLTLYRQKYQGDWNNPLEELLQDLGP